MTLIIGIKCSDGVVMGADGAATLGAPPSLRTVVQPISKLQLLHGKMIMGVSGQVGLGQLYCDKIESLWRDKKVEKKLTLPDVQRLLGEAVSQDIKTAIEQANNTIPILGNSGALQSVSTHSLIALPVGGNTGNAELFQLYWDGKVEAASNDLPFISVGSGQPLADPFLAFLRHIFWPDKLPKVAEGIFVVVWTLAHAIEVNPGGVSDPIQLAVLDRRGGGELVVRELSQDEIGEHREMILEAEERLRHFKDEPSSASPAIPEVPAKEKNAVGSLSG